MKLVTVLLVLILAGCVSPQQQAAQEEAARQQYWASLNSRCTSLGYASGTDAHRGCIMQLHQIEEQRRAALGAALIGSGMLNRAPASNPYQIPPPAPIRRPTTTNCYTDNLGYTRCTTR